MHDMRYFYVKNRNCSVVMIFIYIFIFNGLFFNLSVSTSIVIFIYEHCMQYIFFADSETD